MSSERVIQREDEIGAEEKAERTIEVEQRLQELAGDDLSSEDETEPEVRVELSRNATSSIRRADVLEAQLEERSRSSNLLHLTVSVDGEKHVYTLPEPSDIDDTEEPVVRLCRWRGVDPRWFADLETVPVVRVGNDWRLLIPPAKRTQEVEVVIGGQPIRFSRYTFTSRARVAATRLAGVFLRTPFAKMCPACETHGVPAFWPTAGAYAAVIAATSAAWLTGVSGFGMVITATSVLLALTALMVAVVAWAGGADFKSS